MFLDHQICSWWSYVEIKARGHSQNIQGNVSWYFVHINIREALTFSSGSAFTQLVCFSQCLLVQSLRTHQTIDYK